MNRNRENVPENSLQNSMNHTSPAAPENGAAGLSLYDCDWVIALPYNGKRTVHPQNLL